MELAKNSLNSARFQSVVFFRACLWKQDINEMKKSESIRPDIDQKNLKFWRDRYIDPSGTLRKSLSVLRIAEKSGYDKGVAYSKLNMAACSFLRSENDDAMQYVSEALQWFTANIDEPGYAWALNLKGSLHESTGDYENALQMCLDAHELAVNGRDPETIAETSSQLGLIYTRLSNYHKASEHYFESLRIREEMKDEKAMASSLNRIGMIMRLTGRYDESLGYYFRSLEIRKRKKHSVSVPWTYLGIASTYEEMQKSTDAIRYYEQGIAEGDKRCALQCMLGAGRIYSVLGDSCKAEERFAKALQIAQDLKAATLIADAYRALADHYESVHKYEDALANIRLHHRTMESVKSEEIRNRLRQIEISNAIEKSEHEKEIYHLRNIELRAAYELVEEKNNYITASINYASRIQRVLLPDPEETFDEKQEYFILNLPLEIVSGDFYWFHNSGSSLIIAVGDCSGHGVAGALMSIMGITLLEEIVNTRGIVDSDRILNELRKEVRRALRQKGDRDETKEGIDISVCIIDRINSTLQFSGAFNNLWIVSNGELTELQGDRMTIDSSEADDEFIRTDVAVSPGDTIYMCTDGFSDQLGGPSHKKYRADSLKALLIKTHKLPLAEQKMILERDFIEWKGTNPQTDDILVVGIKI